MCLCFYSSDAFSGFFLCFYFASFNYTEYPSQNRSFILEFISIVMLARCRVLPSLVPLNSWYHKLNIVTRTHKHPPVHILIWMYALVFSINFWFMLLLPLEWPLLFRSNTNKHLDFDYWLNFEIWKCYHVDVFGWNGKTFLVSIIEYYGYSLRNNKKLSKVLTCVKKNSGGWSRGYNKIITHR